VHLLVDVLTVLCVHSCSTHRDPVLLEEKMSFDIRFKRCASGKVQTVRDSKHHLCLTTHVSGMPVCVSDATAL